MLVPLDSIIYMNFLLKDKEKKDRIGSGMSMNQNVDDLECAHEEVAKHNR